MKILFISVNGNEDADFGGPKGSIRNYKVLSIFGDVDVYTIRKISNFHSFLSLMCGMYPPISHVHKKALRKLHNNNYDLVFFDGSIYGDLIDIFTDNKKVVFYHNCESDFNRVRFGEKKSVKKSVYQFLINRNEKIISNKANYRMVLSERDADRIHKLYGVEADCIAPLGIEDKYTGINRNNNKGYCLLLGVVCPPNVEGYKWFIDNVSPFLKCKTVIAGRGFEQFRSQWSDDIIEVIGYVENLEEVYANAECVAIPLFSGGGMKVKTVEALMFGKTVFGTDEAFSGFKYEMDGCSYVCNKAEEFVVGINNYLETEQPLFNEKSREVYKEKYSVDSTLEIFRKMLKELEVIE